MDVRRVLPLSGLLFVVIALVAVVGIGGDTPASDASAEDILAFYDEHTVRQGIAAFVLAAAIPFLVFFAVSLATALWPEGTDRPPVWQYVLIGGSLLAGAALLGAASIVFALADGGDNEAPAEALKALNLLDGNTWVAFNAGFGVMMLGAAGCVIPRVRTTIPVWLGWTALVLGIALFIPFADFIALLLTLIWIIVVSVLLFRVSSAAVPVPASPGG